MQFTSMSPAEMQCLTLFLNYICKTFYKLKTCKIQNKAGIAFDMMSTTFEYHLRTFLFCGVHYIKQMHLFVSVSEWINTKSYLKYTHHTSF